MGKYCPNCYDDLEKQILFNDNDDYDCLCCGSKLHFDFIANEYVMKFECPQCGSVLNEQIFFNKYDGTWKCTCCETELEHSYCEADYTIVEKHFQEKIFECPNCGEILNNQILFDSLDSNWICDDCGCELYHEMYYDEYEIVNKAESATVKNEEISNDSLEDENEYFCPNCNAILNKQKGFNPNNSTWTCKGCGQFLIDDNIYNGEDFEGVAWFCDKCEALLNEQPGFSDTYGSWICAKCKHRNPIDKDHLIE